MENNNEHVVVKKLPALGRFLCKFETASWGNFLFKAFSVLAVISLAADFFYKKKPYFDFETLLGFYPFFTIICCVAVIFPALILRSIFMRSEDYYGDKCVDDEAYRAEGIEPLRYDGEQR